MKLKQKKAIWIPLSLCVIVVLACILLVALRSNKLSDDIVILYTNDVHTYIDGPVSYDTVAAIRGELEEKYEDVLLVDAGDHIQGTGYGSRKNDH